MSNLTEVVAVSFPSHHRDELYDRWYGPAWNEWRLMEQTRPLFPGHEQPKLCAWGSFDEADPRWMERQIDLAADHRITSFLRDSYWYSGQKFLHRVLEDGFLKARNRQRVKFFITWANHTWGVFAAWRELFRGSTRFERQTCGQALAYDKPLLEMRHTPADLERAFAYCLEHYLHEPNYLRVDGKPAYFPSGKYRITDTLAIYSPWLHGDGMDVSVISQTNPTKDILFVKVARGGHVSGLGFSGSAKQLNRRNIQVDLGLMQIEDCAFAGCTDFAMYMEDRSNPMDLVIRGCAFTYLGQVLYTVWDQTTVCQCGLPPRVQLRQARPFSSAPRGGRGAVRNVGARLRVQRDRKEIRRAPRPDGGRVHSAGRSS